jgi:hypothetical protein
LPSQHLEADTASNFKSLFQHFGQRVHTILCLFFIKFQSFVEVSMYSDHPIRIRNGQIIQDLQLRASSFRQTTEKDK